MNSFDALAAFGLGTGLGLVGPVIAFIVVLVRARGRVRVIGAVATGLVIISTLLSGLLSLYLPLLQRRLDLPIGSLNLIFVPTTVIGWAGTILLAVAIVIRPAARTSSSPYGDGYRTGAAR